MSGDLRDPSKSIPKGTLAGILLTFFTYVLVIISMAASITRESLYNNVNIVQLVSGLSSLLKIILADKTSLEDEYFGGDCAPRRVCCKLFFIINGGDRIC